MATVYHHSVRVPLDSTTLYVEVVPVYTLEFRLRMWLGVLFLRMAAWTLGCNFQFDKGDGE